MKFALLVCLALAVASSLAVDSDELEFQQYMHKHNKQYHTQNEYQHRFSAYKQNVRKIQALNNKQNTAVFAVNEFSDLYEHEFRRSHLMPQFDAGATCQWPFNATKLSTASAPDSWDWRTQGKVVTPVKNQQQCGSCWTFSVTGNIEGQWALGKKELISLSEQDIVDCAHGCLKSMPQLCNGGCGGGLPWLAYEDVIQLGGLPTETSYPYTAVDGTCNSNGTTPVVKISSWVPVGTDVPTIEAYLVAHGPLSITLNANPLMSYSSGIITEDASQCPGDQSDHAVLLVGYGTDAGTHYWIVKNSWGTSWGEQGYFRIAANGLCGTNLCVTSSVL